MDDIPHLDGYQQLGVAILMSAVKHRDYSFLQGRCLEAVVDTFGLNIDPEKIRANVKSLRISLTCTTE